MSTSTAPAALTALTALAVAAIPGRQIVKGAALNNLGQQYLLIGWNEQGAGINSVQRPADAGGRSAYEVYDVSGVVVSWSGGDSGDTVTDQVYSDLDAIETALIGNPSLDGVCMYAQLTSSAWTLERGNNRVQASLQFVINVQASRI